MSCKPRWDGPFEGYAQKFVRAHHWQVRHTLFEPEDALQECAVVFVRCVRRYGPRVTSPAQLMALYKRMLINAFIDHARASQQYGDKIAAVTKTEHHRPLGGPSAAPLLAALGGASPELQQVLKVIGRAPNGLLRLMLRDRGIPKHPHDRRTLSRAWCRLAGTARVREDLVDELQTILAT